MHLPLSSIPKTKVGTCPHGLPQGACPICNGMGGGGGNTKKADKPAGEMSWDECFAVGQMMKAQKLAQQQKNESIQSQMISQYKMQLSMGSIAQKMVNLAEKLTYLTQKSQSNPTIGYKILAFGAKLTLPVLNGLKNVAILADKTLNLIREKLTDISDKLNAIFGELKNSTEKKVSERLKDFKKKFKSIFGIYEPEDILDEEKQIDEKKKLFELKTMLTTIKEKFTNKKN